MDVVHECDGQTVCIAYTLHLHAVRRAVRKHYELTKVGLIRLLQCKLCTLWVKKLDPFSFEHNFDIYCPILIFFHYSDRN